MSADMFFALFKTDAAAKQAQKEKEEGERETAKACTPRPPFILVLLVNKVP
jgi:hypothetical protein